MSSARRPARDSGVQRLRALKVLISVSEIAKDANIHLALESANGAASPFSRLSSLKAKVAEEKRHWADRLLGDSNGITAMRDQRVAMAFGKLPQPQAIVNAAYAFNGTQEKIKSGIAPPDEEWSSFEKLARLIFLSNTLAQTLGVTPNSSEGMLGYLAVWKDSGLKGPVSFGELTGFAGASMFADATDSDQLGQDSEATEPIHARI